MAEILVDSNVMVYPHDLSEPEKQLRALEVLDRLVETALGVLIAQTLAEFCAVAMHKIPISVQFLGRPTVGRSAPEPHPGCL